MKKSFVIILLFLSSVFCFAQDTIKNEKKQSGQHSVYMEFFGNAGLWYSIGYDYMLNLKEKHKLSFNCGFQYFPYTDYNLVLEESVFTLSPQINYLYGKKHHLELGVGITYDLVIRYRNSVDKTATGWSVPFRIGYRYQKEDGGFFFKIAYIPAYINHYVLMPIIGDDWFMPLWAGVAIGYTFKNKKH